MADVTISSLPLGTPSGNGIIPFSLGGNTYSSPISGIFQNRPAFHVWNQTAQTLTGNMVMTFNATSTNQSRVFNQGGHYADNRFTAPVAGVYQFSVNVLLNVASGGIYWGIGLVKNGEDTIEFSYAAGTTQQSLNVSSTIKLAALDYIDVRASTNGTIIIDNSGTFSGHLVG